MIGYRGRLELDLARWQAAGHVSEAGARAIRSDLDSRGGGVSLAPVLALLGAVLLGFAAMSFIAANWQAMSKLARLGLLFGTLWGCYGAAALLHRKGLTGFAEAAVLGGIGMFGASIMLIAQMYHIEGHPPDAVLMWGAGALLAGVLLGARAAFGASAVLLVVWSGYEMAVTDRVHWGFLAGWLAVTAVILWHGWRPGLHLSALALAWWIASLGYLLPLQTPAASWFAGSPGRHDVVVALGLLIAAAAWSARSLLDRQFRFAWPAVAYGLAIAYSGLIAAQFADRVYAGTLALLALATLALVIGAIWLGARRGAQGLVWLGYGGFSAEILALYAKTVGTLMGTSLFFFTAGLLVIALSWFAWWLHKRGQAGAGSAPLPGTAEARA